MAIMRFLALALCLMSSLAWCEAKNRDRVNGADDDSGWQYWYGLVADDEDMESGQAEDVYDMLAELATDKINLNRATREDLERLVFLTDRQLQDLAEYIDRYGPVRSLAELAMVPSIDAMRRRLLAFFVYAGEPQAKAILPPLDTLLRRSRSELAAAIKIPLYNREGDLRGAEKGYLGPKYKHWLRYKIGYGRQIEAGFTASQDAGEPFFTGRNRLGYDFYSFYAVVRNMGWLKTAVAGRYRMKLGMGLMMNTDFSFGKAASLDGLSRTSNSLRPHSSRSEANYLQGVAATANLSRHLSLTAFFSHRLIDATLNKDSATVKTILKTGYHRTASEMARRRNTSQTVGGASMAVRSGGFTAALSAMGTTFNRQLRPDTSAVFRRFYPKGQRFGNASLSYSYLSPRLQVAGEAAVASSGGMATLNTVAFAPSSSLSLRLVYRYYSYRYHSLFASAFSDGGNVSNEQGVYLGMAWRPVAPLLLTAYADYARFPWPRYMVSFASRSWDGQLAATLSLNRLTLNARYRVRLRQRDNAKHTGLTDRTEQRLRLSAIVQHDVWRLATQADMALASADSTSKGYMVMQSGGFKTGRLTVDGNVAYFHTDSYDSRLYVYERGLLYNFSFPMFYGEGLHYALRVRYDFTRRLMFLAKASVTNHLDRSTIGSGLQRINRSSQTDVEMQVRWKF